jgi:hypothetical protein
MHAVDDDTLICGDYQYKPLAGYITKNGIIRPGTSLIYLNTPERKTKKILIRQQYIV